MSEFSPYNSEKMVRYEAKMLRFFRRVEVTTDWSIGRIANQTGIPWRSAYVILHRLLDVGVVVKDADGYYRVS